MTVRLRLSADPEEIAVFVAWLESNGAEVAGGDRRYANRGGFGERAYLEVRLPDRVRADTERLDRRELPERRQRRE